MSVPCTNWVHKIIHRPEAIVVRSQLCCRAVLSTFAECEHKSHCSSSCMGAGCCMGSGWCRPCCRGPAQTQAAGCEQHYIHRSSSSCSMDVSSCASSAGWCRPCCKGLTQPWAAAFEGCSSCMPCHAFRFGWLHIRTTPCTCHASVVWAYTSVWAFVCWRHFLQHWGAI